MKKLLLFIAIFNLSHLSFSQVNTPTWGVEDTVLNIVKTTAFGVVHDYLEIYNNSGQDLTMRWIPQDAGNWPSQWIPYFDDPDSSYINPHYEDSADFELLNPPGFSNKLIISVDHQSFAANSVMSFKVFPVDFPEDSLWIHYKIYIGEPEELGVNTVNGQQDYWYNASNHEILVKDVSTIESVRVFDLSGKLMLVQKSNLQSISVRSLNKGLYFVQITEKGNLKTKSFKFNKSL